MPALAYLITYHTYHTYHTYGSWLHGQSPGSIDRKHNRVGTDFTPVDISRRKAMQRRMTGEPFLLGRQERSVVRQAIEGVATHRGWELGALHIRTNHVHAVVTANATPERVMNDFKVWSTRKLRERGLASENARVWSRHGSTRYLNTKNAVERACRYVLNSQGADLD